MDEAELKNRTKAFALRCIKLADSISGSSSGRTLAGQLVRSGTSVGANYRAACRARSKAEFCSKLGIVEEEVDECAYWMELIIESGLKRLNLVQPLHDEADQLTRIIASSIRTVRGRKIPIQNPQSKIQNS